MRTGILPQFRVSLNSYQVSFGHVHTDSAKEASGDLDNDSFNVERFHARNLGPERLVRPFSIITIDITTQANESVLPRELADGPLCHYGIHETTPRNGIHEGENRPNTGAGTGFVMDSSAAIYTSPAVSDGSIVALGSAESPENEACVGMFMCNPLRSPTTHRL